MQSRCPVSASGAPADELVLLEILERHVILAHLLGANLPVAGFGTFHTRHDTRLEGLAFLDELFHALRACLLGTRQACVSPDCPAGRVPTS